MYILGLLGREVSQLKASTSTEKKAHKSADVRQNSPEYLNERPQYYRGPGLRVHCVRRNN